MKPRKPRGEAHVRLYRHELESAAYRSLSTDARALLVEFRALFDGKENEIFLSVREMQRRLGIGQRPAQAARDELLDRGFIRLMEPGGFNRKTRHASVYALESEPLDLDKAGATAPKTYMRWKESIQNTVAKTTTVSSQNSYREMNDGS